MNQYSKQKLQYPQNGKLLSKNQDTINHHPFPVVQTIGGGDGLYYCFVLLLVLMATPVQASPLQILQAPAILTHGAMIQVAYGLAALATLGIAFMAFGKEFKWRWFVALVGSLAIIASSTQIIGFVADPDGTNTTDRDVLFGNAEVLTARTSNSAKFIAYGVAAIGAIGLATVSILGKWKWPWLWGIVGGLAVIALFPDTALVVDARFENADVLTENTGRDGFADAAALANRTSLSMKYIVYGFSAIGTLCLATLAFVGKFQWRWFFMIIGGLTLVAGTYQLAQYLGVTS